VITPEAKPTNRNEHRRGRSFKKTSAAKEPQHKAWIEWEQAKTIGSIRSPWKGLRLFWIDSTS